MYIFPQNYNFKNRLFGLIDYSTIIFNIIWCLFVYSFFSIFINSLYIKMCLIIIFAFPLLLLSIIGINNENILYVLFYMIKFIKNRAVILYSKY